MARILGQGAGLAAGLAGAGSRGVELIIAEKLRQKHSAEEEKNERRRIKLLESMKLDAEERAAAQALEMQQREERLKFGATAEELGAYAQPGGPPEDLFRRAPAFQQRMALQAAENAAELEQLKKKLDLELQAARADPFKAVELAARKAEIVSSTFDSVSKELRATWDSLTKEQRAAQFPNGLGSQIEADALRRLQAIGLQDFAGAIPPPAVPAGEQFTQRLVHDIGLAPSPEAARVAIKQATRAGKEAGLTLADAHEAAIEQAFVQRFPGEPYRRSIFTRVRESTGRDVLPVAEQAFPLQSQIGKAVAPALRGAYEVGQNVIPPVARAVGKVASALPGAAAEQVQRGGAVAAARPVIELGGITVQRPPRSVPEAIGAFTTTQQPTTGVAGAPSAELVQAYMSGAISVEEFYRRLAQEQLAILNANATAAVGVRQ